MTRWWWVRHGPTHVKAFVGHRDVPADLSDHAQIARLNAYLPGDALLISSDLIRASATAAAVSKTRTLLGQHRDLREFDFGVWDGMTFADVAARDPELSRDFWEKPGDLAAPDGESWNDVSARVGHFVDQMNKAHPNQDIIAVAHIGVIMTQIQKATGGTAYQALGHHVDNLSVTDMTWDGVTWQIGVINHVP